MKIIVQAGGKGTRLEWLTRNKPKCLVPVNGKPILFYLFEKFKESEFFIIADYKIEVLKKYLGAFAKDYNYHVEQASQKGTISGISDIIEDFEENEPFMIVWCDLILGNNFSVPKVNGNYVGISKGFECRWSYIDNSFIKEPSTENGVAGLFIFKDKSVLNDLPQKGAFVDWLKDQNIKFLRLDLEGTEEIGTLLSYSENNDDSKPCRPFNSMEFDGDVIIKRGITEQGKNLAKVEVDWYKYVKSLDYDNIPKIYEYEPLKMKIVKGKNIWEYDCLTVTQKKEILKNLIEALKNLHNLVPPIDANLQDIYDNYIGKTYDRLEKVRDLIPFADQKFIKINGRYYKNVYFCRKEIEDLLTGFVSKEFRLIHGDCTFSNLMYDTFNMKAVLIDPRGYFGKTKYFGDVDYDWAKLYYSLKGNYDQFNKKKFTLDIKEDSVEIAIKPNNWEDMDEYFFDSIPNINKSKIKVLHAIIWLSLTTYAWDDYDSICGAFYNGLVNMGDVL